MSEKLLEIRDLQVCYHSDGDVVEAVNTISLDINKGEVIGLVGETGAGKTTTALSIMHLLPIPQAEIKGGTISFDFKKRGKGSDPDETKTEELTDLYTLSKDEILSLRGGQISMIFQDPMTSLNPVFSVGDQIAEVVALHQPDIDPKQRAEEMMEMVGIHKNRYSEYPHQFSGGMKQRIIIAIALACNPRLLIADEPTTALDVTIQAQVLEMMRDLKVKFNTSMLMITHDLGVVAQTCDKVGIMYAGDIVEFGTLEDIFKNPQHPYTLGLFASIPSLDKDEDRLKPIEGFPPDATNLPKGCNFYPRCEYARELCAKKAAPECVVQGEHRVSCFMVAKDPEYLSGKRIEGELK